MKEYESFDRIGTEPHRSYYIPFDENDTVAYKYGIVDRSSSSRFLSLDGEWLIGECRGLDSFDPNEELERAIPVPSCVQMHGFDTIQYINSRYPFPVMPPHIPYDTPVWHYRRYFNIAKREGELYYLNFEGVDSAFYLYVNGEYKGYSQISHSTSEFEISGLLEDGENRLDVFVLKWCASSYLECQDKFRFSGIFRSVYLLSRPKLHITDYKIETELHAGGGILRFINESPVGINLSIEGMNCFAKKGQTKIIEFEKLTPWNSENPKLYTLELIASGEKIIERVGFREVSIEGGVFKINGDTVKLKGVNRHEFNCDTASTVTLDNMVDDIRLMKELNVNAVRTSHYPDCPDFYLLCDKEGLYVMDEADLEMHGAATRGGGYDGTLWREYAEDKLFSQGITDRHISLVERDKNRTSVIIWSLGNESSFGEAFIAGAKHVKERDKTRPVHYEGLQNADEKYYYTDLVDMVSMMYPSIETIKEKVLDNPKETRPFVLCEYTHAMGNSLGDIADYWKLIYAHEQMMGAFVWEWADHGIRTERGFLYGGDFGEKLHDGNFCVDGLLTPDRKLKSGALEMKAVYSGKTSSPIKEIEIPKNNGRAKEVKIEVDGNTAEITSIKADGSEILNTPIGFNITRYTDNDRALAPFWYGKMHLDSVKSYVHYCEKEGNRYRFVGSLCADSLMPAVYYEVEYRTENNNLVVSVEYKVADYVKSLPRFGFEFCIDKCYSDFAYVGYGRSESYVDKHVAADYGYYESVAKENYDINYIRPQESGSHYASKHLEVKGLFSVTADKDFSFSVNPYTTAQLRDTLHNFELPENNFTCVCIDLAMRGIGSASCGPDLDGRYEIPKKAKNTFVFTF